MTEVTKKSLIREYVKYTKLYIKNIKSGEYEAGFTYYEISKRKLEQVKPLFDEVEIRKLNALKNSKFQHENQDCNFDLMKLNNITLSDDRIALCLDLQLEIYLSVVGEIY